MDKARACIASGDLAGFRVEIERNPTLVVGEGHALLNSLACPDGKRYDSHAEMVKVLVAAGAELEPKKKMSPVRSAASVANQPVLEALLDSGASPEGWDGDLRSPLAEAIYWHNTDIVRLLLQRGAVVDDLPTVAGTGRIDRLKEMMQARVYERHRVDEAFVYACRNHQFEAAEYLLQNGASANAREPGDWQPKGAYATVLHLACASGNRKVVKFLVEHGADLAIRDDVYKATSLGWAKHHNHKEIVDYLQLHGADE